MVYECPKGFSCVNVSTVKLHRKILREVGKPFRPLGKYKRLIKSKNEKIFPIMVQGYTKTGAPTFSDGRHRVSATKELKTKKIPIVYLIEDKHFINLRTLI